MDNRELEQKIKSSYRNIAPDILDSVLADCDAQKGRIITMQEKKKNKSVIRYISGLAAALLLVVGGLGFYQANHAIASTVMLDVNPGIGINVNKSEKVLDVTPYNEDAKTVIGDMDFAGSSLDVTVNALIGSMLRNGYINEDANSVLISVDSKDQAAGAALQTRLMNEINGIMESENLSGAVLGQTVEDDKALQQSAQQYGITLGKAKLIDQITRQNTLYAFADLVPLTINELNLISESGGTKLENIESIGTASASAYIGEQSAKDAALQRAQVSADKVSRIRCELDWEKGIMVYEVDFDAEGYEYDVEINATTGEVVRYEREIDDDFVYVTLPQNAPAEQKAPTAQQKAPVAEQKAPTAEQTPATPQYVDEETAKQAAFRHAGVEAANVFDYACEVELKRGIRIYEIEFAAGGFEYDYDVNAETAEVIRYSKEKDDDYHAWKAESTPPAAPAAPAVVEQPASTATEVKTDDIGADAARAAALNHAGVSDVWDYECERDFEHGKTVYEISFQSGGYEYDYEIDAASGAVLKSEKERD